MSRLALLLALSLSACAALTRDDAPGCSGPRRPANPHGSVLSLETPTPPEPKTAHPAGGCMGARR